MPIRPQALALAVMKVAMAGHDVAREPAGTATERLRHAPHQRGDGGISPRTRRAAKGSRAGLRIEDLPPRADRGPDKGQAAVRKVPGRDDVETTAVQTRG